jgi:hypothetical protein
LKSLSAFIPLALAELPALTPAPALTPVLGVAEVVFACARTAAGIATLSSAAMAIALTFMVVSPL